jgi:NAD(P)-dependent dehydrogenase (short-subunit alcohol dehydrogenase family)
MTTTLVVGGIAPGPALASCEELARRGAHVIVHGLSESACRSALVRLSAAAPSASFSTVTGEVATLADVRALASNVYARFERLDRLVVFGGIERWLRYVNADGVEETLAQNHVAPFYLTRLLAPLLRRSAPARVLFVASVAHRFGRLRLDDLGAERWFSPEDAFRQSELAMATSAMALARRFQDDGVMVNLLEAGLSRPSFSEPETWRLRLWHNVMQAALLRPAEAVARDVATAVLDPAYASVTGACLRRGRVHRAGGRVADAQAQDKLWSVTSEICGLSGATV